MCHPAPPGSQGLPFYIFFAVFRARRQGRENQVNRLLASRAKSHVNFIIEGGEGGVPFGVLQQKWDLLGFSRFSHGSWPWVLVVVCIVMFVVTNIIGMGIERLEFDQAQSCNTIIQGPEGHRTNT